MNHKPLMILAVLPLLALLACTLTAPPAALVEVQNSPLPTAATRTLPPTLTPSPRPTATATPWATEFVSMSCTVATGIETGALNVRSCAGLECYPVAWLYSGDVVTITQVTGNWYLIQSSKISGWIYAKYCEVKP
jgi:uncharacterized protein YgiM (DUF1202 family)